MSGEKIIADALESGEGILRLALAWVPRQFCIPGRRIKLHPDDYYAFGAHRGGIDERWLASTTKADNGPETTPDEGLSYVVFEDGRELHRILLKDAIESLGMEIIGERLMSKYGGWPVFSKFFDNKNPIPFHLHQVEEHAKNVGRESKPEAYYFPPQMNNYGADFPYTFFGLEPAVTKDQIIQCLKDWDKGDNHITDLSRAYRLRVGTGWDVPAGVLHAPGSLCTYEPQYASDVFAMFQSMVEDMPLSRELLVKDVPVDKHQDFDYIASMIDWELNTDPGFYENRFMEPRPVRPVKEMKEAGYVERWIAYRSKDFSAKELVVLPGRTVTISDSACYGFILVQGYGTFGEWKIETPALIRFGELTNDEFFVSEVAAKTGAAITNLSDTEPLVMLKHFGPGNPELRELIQ
jgi:hypothetical protein